MRIVEKMSLLEAESNQSSFDSSILQFVAASRWSHAFKS
jgi:hypothetical protein